MKAMIRAFLVMAAMAVPAGAAFADSYSDTIDLFKHAGASASYFDNSYGYAVFPTIGKGGFIIGGAHGKGRVYVSDIKGIQVFDGNGRYLKVFKPDGLASGMVFNDSNELLIAARNKVLKYSISE